MERGDVAEAAMQLLERGVPVTTRTVREVLGGGSFRDISAHLKALLGEEEPGEADVVPPAYPTVPRPVPPAPGAPQAADAPLDPVAQLVATLWNGGLEVPQIIKRLVAAGARPPDGFPAWSWMAVSRTMDRATLQAAQRRTEA
jgi:Plasmid replication region DNA-binding N-term